MKWSRGTPTDLFSETNLEKALQEPSFTSATNGRPNRGTTLKSVVNPLKALTIQNLCSQNHVVPFAESQELCCAPANADTA